MAKHVTIVVYNKVLLKKNVVICLFTTGVHMQPIYILFHTIATIYLLHFII